MKEKGCCAAAVTTIGFSCCHQMIFFASLPYSKKGHHRSKAHGCNTTTAIILSTTVIEDKSESRFALQIRHDEPPILKVKNPCVDHIVESSFSPLMPQ